MLEKRESYQDYMRYRLREGQRKGGKMIDRTLAENEIANMQEQVHLLQMRIKELSEMVYSLTHTVSILGGDINQLELEL